MPITTYLYENEHLVPTSDTELNETLASVREMTGEDWRVSERIEERYHWWAKKPFSVRKFYEVYKQIVPGEYQIFNFYPGPEHGLSSINIVTSAQVVVAFLYGILSGVIAGKEQATKERKG